MSGFKHQDWEVVVVRKKNPSTVNKSKKTVLKKKNPNSNKMSNDSKVKDDDEIKKIKKIGKEIGIKIQQARAAKKLKQKDLANRLSVQSSLIQKYETGEAPYNGRMLSRIEKILGVKLTGKKK